MDICIYSIEPVISATPGVLYFPDHMRHLCL